MSDKNFRHFCKGEVASPLISALGNGLGDPSLTNLEEVFMSFIITIILLLIKNSALKCEYFLILVGGKRGDYVFLKLYWLYDL